MRFATRPAVQLSAAEKEARARELIKLGSELADRYRDSWIGLESSVIPEQLVDGCWEGYTPEYIRVRLDKNSDCTPGCPVRVSLISADSRGMRGKIIP